MYYFKSLKDPIFNQRDCVESQPFKTLKILLENPMIDLVEKTILKTSPSRLFQILTKVPEWPSWDKDVLKVEFNAPENVSEWKGKGGKLFMKFKKAPFDFAFETVDVNEKMSYVVDLPLCKSVWYWNILPKNEETVELQMGVQLTGFLSSVYSFILGKDISKALKDGSQNLKALAESN